MTRPLDHAALIAAPLPRYRGQRSTALLDALSQRDELLRAARSRFYGALSKRSAAAVLHRELVRYSALAWFRDRAEVDCPRRHEGKPAELFWSILKLRDYVPSERVIRRALAA